MRLWRLFVPPLLAVGIALGLLLFPATEPKDLSLWGMVFLVGLAVGMARGFFVNFQVDQVWHLIRLLNARDGRSATIALVVLGAIDMATSLAQPVGSPYHPVLAACTGACAAFLASRAVTVGMRARQQSHFELHA